MVKFINIKNVVINHLAIAKHLSLIEEEDILRIKEMCEQVKKIAKPKALYKVAYINDRKENHLIIDTTAFDSRLMYENFKDIHRVFPFVVTCGIEVNKWANTIEDMFERYWADYIMEYILRNAIKDLYDDIKSNYDLKRLASMNPGSLSGWPIEQQQNLFELLEDNPKKIGIQLTKTFLMLPNKSVSGVLFPSSSNYVNCKLCERTNCPDRRAKFNAQIKEQLQGE